MINLKDRSAILKYHNWVNRQLRMLERKYSKVIQAVIKDQYYDAADYVLHGVGIESVNDAINFNNKDLEKAFTNMYQNTDKIFHEKTKDAFKSMTRFSYKASEERYFYNLNKWIKKQAGERVVAVSKTTKKNIRNIIEYGMNNGQSNAEIAKEIYSLEAITTKFRAARIARTETHTAAMRAETETIIETGIATLKIWSAAMDERTRDSHVNADEYYKDNPIEIEEAFVVGDSMLMYPGDADGSAAEIINCRCVPLFETKEI